MLPYGARNRRGSDNAFPPISPEDVRPWEQVRSTLRRRVRPRNSRLHLVGLVIVCAAWIGSGWLLAPRVDVELSALTTLSKELGLVRTGDPPHPAMGYDTEAIQAQDAVGAQAVPGPR
jgi:hypothetical protein